MTTVIAERRLEQSHSVEEARAILTDQRRHLALCGVRSLRHYIASDGRRLVSVFDAADTRAVADAVQPVSLWPATPHPIGSSDAGSSRTRAYSTVVVERSLEVPVPFDQLAALEEAGRGCFEMRDVKPIVSYVSKDGRRFLCVYVAPDAESVRRANQYANLPFDNAWAATLVIDDDCDWLPGH